VLDRAFSKNNPAFTQKVALSLTLLRVDEYNHNAEYAACINCKDKYLTNLLG
jgi:hypothetical protein